MFRWSGDVSTTDSEVVGPFSSEEKCSEVALGEHTDDSISSPIQWEEMVNNKPIAAKFMGVCFWKIGDLSINKSLPARSRFMYKDLIDLRKNQWIPFRKEEKAKTIDEIRRDFEQEERNPAEQSQRENARGSMNQSFCCGGVGPRNETDHPR